MKLKILKNDSSIHSPAKIGDAGFDIVAKSQPKVIGSIYQGFHYTAISHIEYETNLVIEPEIKNDEYLFYNLLYPRSSIINTNLVLANSVGVIDSGYRGTVKVCFKYIAQPEDMKIIEGKSVRGRKANGVIFSINPQRVYQEGDKIAQIIPSMHNKVDISFVDEMSETDRGLGGFGSTGK